MAPGQRASTALSSAGSVTGRSQTKPRQTYAVGCPSRIGRPATMLTRFFLFHQVGSPIKVLLCKFLLTEIVKYLPAAYVEHAILRLEFNGFVYVV